MPTSPHSSHDEILIARLHGDDLDAGERAAALEQVATCGTCAELLSDLRAISGRMTELPVPTRTRDFFLTEADAARLRRRPGVLGRLLGLGARRSFGGALAALGLAGFLAVGTLSLLGSPTSSSFGAIDNTQSKALVPEAGGPGQSGAPGASGGQAAAGDQGGAGGGIAIASIAPVPSAAMAATTVAPTTGGTGAVTPPPAPSVLTPPAPAGPVPPSSVNPNDVAGAGSSTTGGQGAQPPGPAPAAPSAPGGIDPRTVALALSAAGLVAGLLILAVPAIRRRRAS